MGSRESFVMQSVTQREDGVLGGGAPPAEGFRSRLLPDLLPSTKLSRYPTHCPTVSELRKSVQVVRLEVV